MKKIKFGSLILACLIFTSVFVGMSISSTPNTAEASDVTTEPLENETTDEAHGTISVTGIGRIDLSPDLMAIYLKIKANDFNSAKVAKDKAAKIINDVLDALKKLGFTEEDIETVSYKIYPKYEWEDNKYGHNQKVFKGYFVESQMKVEVKDFDKAGLVIDKSVDAGALIDKIDFELTPEKRNEVKVQVLAEAAKDAKLKATAIVEAIGDELGDAKTINADDYSYTPKTYWRNTYEIMADGTSASAPPTTILAGDLTVSANVKIVFEIL